MGQENSTPQNLSPPNAIPSLDCTSPSSHSWRDSLPSHPFAAIASGGPYIGIVDVTNFCPVDSFRVGPSRRALRLEVLPSDRSSGYQLAVTQGGVSRHALFLHDLNDVSCVFDDSVHHHAMWGLSTLRDSRGEVVGMITGDWGGGVGAVWHFDRAEPLQMLADVPLSVFQIKNEVYWDEFYLAGAESTGLRQYDSYTLKLLSLFPSDHSQFILGLATIPSLSLLLTCSNDETLRAWSHRTHECVRIGSVSSRAKSLLYDTDLNLVYVGLDSGAIEIFDPRYLSSSLSSPSQCLATFSPASANIYDISKLGPNLFGSTSVNDGATLWSGGLKNRELHRVDLTTETIGSRFQPCYSIKRIPCIEEEDDNGVWVCRVEREDEEERIGFWCQMMMDRDSGGIRIVVVSGEVGAQIELFGIQLFIK